MTAGWYKQQRDLSERPWYKDSAMVHLYTYLKECAYVADSRYHGQIIRRGSCPVTRSDMAYVTGMSHAKIDRILRKLVNFGEIIIRANSRFSVITVCDYDRCVMPENLFRTTDDTTGDTTDDTTGDTTPPIYIKEDKNIYNNHISTSPYMMEREREENVAFEIKKRYNRFFDGKLPPCIRLTLPTRLMVEECVRRFGLQSVDIVFDQILHEKFSLGLNKTGFVARFQFIFEPKNFQGYLERASLRRKTADKDEAGNLRPSVGVVPTPEPEPTEKERQDARKDYLLSLVSLAQENPSSGCVSALIGAYTSGELAKLGINWKPINL